MPEPITIALTAFAAATPTATAVATAATSCGATVAAVANSSTAATWITAAATVIYTVGTFLLWCTTRAQLRANRDALKLNVLQLWVSTEADIPGSFFAEQAAEVMGQRARASAQQKLIRAVFPELIAALGLDDPKKK